MRANVSQKMFPSLPTVGNMAKHQQKTMFPQQCFLVCPGIYCITSQTGGWAPELRTLELGTAAKRMSINAIDV